MTTAASRSGTLHVLRLAILLLFFVVLVTGLMLWLMGTFHRKADAGLVRPDAGRPVGDAKLAAVRMIEVPATESAVGTVRAVHESAIGSKLLAKVSEVRVKAGQTVKRGELLVKLDDADLQARRQQAVAAVNAARATRDQAKIEFERTRRLFEQASASQLEFDRTSTALKAAEADLHRAEETANETETILSYAEIRSPIDGLVVDKKVDAGDMVTPGQTLLTLYDPTRMQLVASVRESLTHRLEVGQTIPVGVDALGLMCEGQVSEIVPEAQAASRSFLVKVTGPCPPGIYAGMFGRLIIPMGQERILVIPQTAVRHVGQLDLVDVDEGGFLRRRAVQLGRTVDEDVQVLSGLREGERVVVEATATQEGL